MFKLTNEQYKKVVALISERTEHSSEQVDQFLVILQERMDKIGITSLEDLLVRYESIKESNHSERIELLKDVAGFYHLCNLSSLMNTLKEADAAKGMIEYYNNRLEEEKEIQKKLDVTSKEYQDSVKKEIGLLEIKQFHLSNLI